MNAVLRSLSLVALASIGSLTGLGAAGPAKSTAAASAGARDEIAGLRREIARHDELYFRRGTAEISDFEYDQLRRRLAGLEQAFPAEANALPPRPAVADDRSGAFATHAHRERMLSLDKCHTAAELKAFDARLQKALARRSVGYVVEPKYDGIAIGITFEDGKLVRALTRGDGRQGEDVTTAVGRISAIPRLLAVQPPPRTIELRGELYVPFAEFHRINAEREAAGEPPYTHPRAVAAAAMRQVDPGDAVRRGAKVVFFGVGGCEPAAALPATQAQLRAMFERWGLPVVAEQRVVRGADELLRAVEGMRTARAGLGFPTDGCVVKVDARSAQRELGETESAPRWAVAYKFAPERAETRVLAITPQVGRTGVLTPVAELAPVELGGSTIARVTLHNRDEIARRDVRVGDAIFIEKAGDIIPAVAGVNLTRRPASAVPYAFPESCPSCQTALARRAGEVAVRCPNRSCPAQIRRRIEHFASQACVDIAGLGPSAVDALVSSGKVANIADLYRLRREDVRRLEQAGVRSVELLLQAIDASRRAEWWRFIHGLGIPGVGAAAARDLARRFADLGELVDARETDPATRAVAAHFADPRNRALAADLLALGVRPAGSGDEKANAVFAGKTFALTGTLPTLTRAEATAMIHAAGGKTTSSVSRATNYIVVGTDAGGKLEQARRLGVPVIDEAELRRMLERPAGAAGSSRADPR